MLQIRFVFYIMLFFIFLFVGCGDDGGDTPVAPLVFPSTGQISFDKTSYYSTNNAATVTLVDGDLTNTNMVTVQVVSASDPVGIMLTLTNNNGTNFKGSLWFSQSNSVAGTTIKIADGDVMLLSYSDGAPIGMRTATAYWWSTIRYGLYNNTYVANKLEFDMPDADPDAGFFVFVGSGTRHLSDSATYRDGTVGKYGYLRNDGMLLKFANPRDLGVYQAGTLKFSIQATNNLMLKLEWTGGSAQVFIGDYATLDGTWQDVSVPLSDFSGIDMSCLDIAFGLHWWHASITAHFWLDMVYLEN